MLTDGYEPFTDVNFSTHSQGNSNHARRDMTDDGYTQCRSAATYTFPNVAGCALERPPFSATNLSSMPYFLLEDDPPVGSCRVSANGIVKRRVPKTTPR